MKRRKNVFTITIVPMPEEIMEEFADYIIELAREKKRAEMREAKKREYCSSHPKMGQA